MLYKYQSGNYENKLIGVLCLNQPGNQWVCVWAVCCFNIIQSVGGEAASLYLRYEGLIFYFYVYF